MANTNKMKVQLSILISNKIDFKTKAIVRVKESQHNFKLYTPNKMFSKYIKQEKRKKDGTTRRNR